MPDPNKKHEPKLSKYGFTYTSREDREKKLANLHRLRHGKGTIQPSIHYGDDNNKWKYNNQKPNKISTRINKS